jgi:2-polyprenyl-3-methyl-5-hydroxy-6-metoxy-1,4-benzoquinol methylase
LDRLKSFEGLQFLDVGCGEGKNAAFISANKGIVEALEISDVALQNRSAHWVQEPLIKWHSGDIRNVELEPDRFDVVVAYGLLHCLSSVNEIAQVLKKLQGATRSGGYNVICAFNSRHQELHAHPGFSPTLLAHDYYLGAYSGEWDIISCSDSDLVETHPHNNIEHTHSMTRLLARKGPNERVVGTEDALS